MGLLRLLLALAVVINHSTPILGFSLIPGNIAVQAFYIISGFYMALILSEKYIGVNSSYKLFITQRLLRLYPIYWVILFMAIVSSIILSVHSGIPTERIVLYKYLLNGNFSAICVFIFLCFSDIFLFFQDWLMFMGFDYKGMSIYFTPNFRDAPFPLHKFLFIPQSWTIGVELTFYLIVPFLARKRVGILLGIMFLSIAIRLLIHKMGYNYDPWTYRFFPTEIVFFLAGILAYRFYRVMPKIHILLNFSLPGLIILTIIFPYIQNIFTNYIYLLLFACLIPFVFYSTKSNIFDSWIGELSYPIYISHLMLINIISKLHLPLLESLGTTSALVCIVFSFVLNYLVSDRVEAIRKRRLNKNIPLHTSISSYISEVPSITAPLKN